ncbi:MAG: class I SAM-dependent methyltransferase [Candidatus Thermoplasmatota archaeon]|jgi:demethylmenaquinone methyltransferase/2-methoxy-6-polyprenyl-1,4-benzoquinol methylase|nr:class I SAM-dependent methyltransferase [Candidatus Thermoplasmatota archaeon]MCL5793741.1 class I SAM-dependent methyltransferase [Candidatus Thermoplasmatota archaeon]
MESKVVSVFNSISDKYDLMDFIMSMGMDQSWRRQMVKLLSPSPGSVILDCGSGTGKLAIQLRKRCEGCTLTCLDITERMFRKEKVPGARFVVASAEKLPFEDASMDFVTSAFLTRNLASVRNYFSEVSRVLKRGGRFINLDIYEPKGGFFMTVFSLYFHRLIPVIGDYLTASKSYSYLSRSVKAFHTPSEITDMLLEAGMKQLSVNKRMLGVINMHLAEKL